MATGLRIAKNTAKKLGNSRRRLLTPPTIGRLQRNTLWKTVNKGNVKSVKFVLANEETLAIICLSVVLPVMFGIE